MIKLELDDSRRLTGKNLLWDHPGAIIDVFVHGIDKTTVIECWQRQVTRLLARVGWAAQQSTYRIFEDGISLALSAPLDALYSAAELNEAAWSLTCDELLAHSVTEDHLCEVLVASLQQLIDDEVNPPLLALIHRADEVNVPWLVDDDEFSLGFGHSAEVWPMAQLPDIERLNWARYRSVPVAMITGTNGKSTSVRLMSEIVKHSGKCAGVTSTDFIRVGDTIIDKGDYSGPGGARIVLRHQAVEVALLEVARGGILRRGLSVPRADAALITNIAEDHLGQYGINTIEGLTATKFVVAKALDGQGTLVLNADDAQLVSYAKQIERRKCWFSCDASNAVVVGHLAAQGEKGGAVCFVRNGMMVYRDHHGSSDIIAVNEVPMTLAGAARHNVQNALGVIGLAKSLNIADRHIAAGLRAFHSDATDNPGRGNIFAVKGARVIMDFAHNEHSMKAIAATTANLPGKQKWLMLSSAGDRSDAEIIAMSTAALSMSPDRLVIAELPDYLRGRAAGEVTELIVKAAKQHGLDESAIYRVASPAAGAGLIVGKLEADDLALMLVLDERDQVVALLTP